MGYRILDGIQENSIRGQGTYVGLLELHVGVGGGATRAIVDAGFGLGQLAQGGNLMLGG